MIPGFPMKLLGRPLHRESDQAQGPHEENDGKDKERLGLSV